MKWTEVYVFSTLLWTACMVAADLQTMTKKKNGIQISNSSEHDKQALLPTLYMTTHCRQLVEGYLHDKNRIYVDSSIIVEATHTPEIVTQTTCIVTFAARQPGERLILHFESMDINFRPGTIDRLRIYDGYDAHDEKTPSHGLYGIYLKNKYERSSGSIHDYTSSGPALTLFFIGKLSQEFTGFRALITVFREPKVDGSCAPTYMKCMTPRCIPEVLKCNGYQNCGQNDLSDSERCNNTPPPLDRNMSLGYSADLWLMVGCVISIVILIVVVVWLGIVCIKRTKRYRAARRYHSPSPHVPPPHSDVDGAIVEPADIHHVVTPPISFLEPPPPYSARPVLATPRDRHLELPPPYTVDERDTAGLLVNESPEGHCPPDTPRSAAATRASSPAPPPSAGPASLPSSINAGSHRTGSRQGELLPMVATTGGGGGSSAGRGWTRSATTGGEGGLVVAPLPPSRVSPSAPMLSPGVVVIPPSLDSVPGSDAGETRKELDEIEAAAEAVDVEQDAPPPEVPPRTDSYTAGGGPMLQLSGLHPPPPGQRV